MYTVHISLYKRDTLGFVLDLMFFFRCFLKIKMIEYSLISNIVIDLFGPMLICIFKMER